MLTVKNVYLSYTKEYNTLNDINFTIESGESVVLFGEKESGKSSLIRIMAGLEKQTKGEMLINNIPVHKVNFKNDVKLGYLSSLGVYFENKTVRQNLSYVLKIRGYSANEILQKVSASILLNKLENLADMKMKDLSDFDKLRVAITRLSLRSLDLLIVDDVFENFSDAENLQLLELIKSLIDKNPGITSVVAVSDEKIASKIKGRKIKIKFGSIVE